MENFKEIKFVIMMLMAVIVWAFAFPFIKIGLEELSFINLTIMRFFLVSLILLLYLVIKPKKFTKLNRKDMIPIFLLGFIGVIIYHLCLNYGEQYVSPAVASLIIATIPIEILILSIIFLKEKITKKKLFGIIIALIGVLIISIWGTEDTKLEVKYFTAAISILISALVGAIYTIGGKKLLKRYNGLSLTTYAMLLGSISLIPFSINGLLIEQVTKLSMKGWFSVIFLALFSTVIGYIIWYIALEKKTAGEISVYLYLIPVISTMISYHLFKAQITLIFILGGFFVIIGLILVNSKIKPSNKQKT